MEKPSFYSIIPATVRYDEDLTPNAKLIYSEITALSNKTGECWATNRYFAKLYGKSNKAVSNWIKQLSKKDYITSQLFYKEGSKEIERRCLRIITHPTVVNFPTPPPKKVIDNNTSNNTTSINIEKTSSKKIKKGFTPPKLDDVISYFKEKGYNRDLAKTFWEGYDASDWQDSQGKPVLNWKQKAIHVWFKDTHKLEVIVKESFNIDNY